jgi:chorismate synthase
MVEYVKKAKADGDSVGGVIECIVYGMKSGVGDNLFEGLECKISSLVYSVPAVKGVEFGGGFSLSEKMGSEANDCLTFNDGKVEFLSNNSGGINGGISNGEEITLRVAVKPTPSISKKQKTIDLIKGENVEIEIKGRHDACIVPRAVPCIESVVAIAILDEILGE